jgi:putative colanic acid biosynthesis acetyltransferase WcaF
MVADCSAFVAIGRFYLQSNTARIVPSTLIINEMSRFSGPTIYLPWRLEIGSHSWIGEEVFILNYATAQIGSHACVSQRAFLCTGNHDFRDPEFAFRGGAISVGDGAWIGAAVFVAPGAKVGDEAVVVAGSVVLKDLPAGMICSGNPAAPAGPRWKD